MSFIEELKTEMTACNTQKMLLMPIPFLMMILSIMKS
jgi:hypothetical protein